MVTVDLESHDTCTSACPCTHGHAHGQRKRHFSACSGSSSNFAVFHHHADLLLLGGGSSKVSLLDAVHGGGIDGSGEVGILLLVGETLVSGSIGTADGDEEDLSALRVVDLRAKLKLGEGEGPTLPAAEAVGRSRAPTTA